MQKRTLAAILGGGCLVVVLLMIGLPIGVGYFAGRALAEQSRREEGEQAVAVLRVERGQATISTSGIEQIVTGETEVKSGDEIVVSDDGRASIIWNAYGRTLMDAGTRLNVTKVERPSGGTLRAGILINIGRTWTRLERLLGVDSEFSVGANNVVATVRGTSFGVERQGDQTVINVKESSVGVARFSDPFTTASFTAYLRDFNADQTIEAGSKMIAEDTGEGSLDPSVPMTESELNDPFLLDGNRALPLEEYDMSGWTSGSERWLKKGIEYLAWRPWLLARINFISAGSFREFYQNIPSSIRNDVESKFGAPDFGEIGRLLQW